MVSSDKPTKETPKQQATKSNPEQATTQSPPVDITAASTSDHIATSKRTVEQQTPETSKLKPRGSAPGSASGPVSGSRSPSVAPSGTEAGTRFRPSTAASTGRVVPNGDRYFRSRRARKEDIQQPWLDKKDPRDKWVTIIPLVGLILGLGLAGLLVWDGFRSVSNHQYCLLLDEDFSYWNGKVWMREVQAGGFGQGQFEMTTSSEDNVFLADNTLVIQPTLQDEAFIEYNNVIDLRGNGCVGEWYDCIATTNVTNGTIINPVNSGRINTKLGSSIKFGRVEVVAKLPVGDWLWPFIIMLPTESKYGPWPRSGQIDIMQSRGNDYKYEQGGNNVVSSTLHFGPNTINDGWWRNNVKRSASRTTFSNDYHTFGVEWSEKYIFTYIGTRLMQVMYTRFDQPFWKYGQFPLFEANGTALQDPWSWTEVNATPFDEDFYLVLGVSVGATNGWFKDGKSAKPWIDSSPTAKQSFWKAREDWYPTWRDQGYMQVKSVKMWQQGGYRGCYAEEED